MSSTATISPAAWSALGSILARDLIVLSAAQRDELAREWEAIAEAERTLDDRLTVGLVGGTGVGKSTLINALAGREVSQAGDRRPTTSRVIAYRHRSTSLPESLPRSDLADPEVCHDTPALERITLLDFPDFDSVEELHHEILARYYPHLDVLIILVDDVKYADARLFELLRRLPQSPDNLHGVLNKLDKLELRYPGRARAVADEILADFSGKVEKHLGLRLGRGDLLAISARQALSRKQGGNGAVDGDFARLEALVDSYRAEKRRRRAKELNLAARQAALARRARDAVADAGAAERISRSAAEVERRRGEIARLLAGISPGILSAPERRRVASSALSRFSGKLGFPIDLVVALAGHVGWRRGAAGAAQGDRAVELSGSRLREHHAAYLEALRNLTRELGIELSGLIAPGALDLAEESFDDAAPELERRISSRLEALGRKSRWRNHALAGGVAGLFLWSAVYPGLAAAVKRLGGEAGATWGGVAREAIYSALAAVSPWSLGGLVFGIAAAYLATALFVWGRRVQAVAQAITETEDACRARVEAAGASCLDGAAGALSRWQAERAEILQATA